MKKTILITNLRQICLLAVLMSFTLVSFGQSKYKVTVQRLNVRATPSVKGSPVGSLYEGAIVTVEEIREDWAVIKFNGKTCYVSAKYLAEVQPATESNNTPVVEEQKENVSVELTPAVATEQPIQPTSYSPRRGPREVLWNLKGGAMQKSYDKDAHTTKKGTDWTLGIGLEIPIGDTWNIETGLRYKEAYRVYEEDWGNGYAKNYANGKTVRMLEIPIRLAYKYALSDQWMLHAGIGPYVSNDLFTNQTDTQIGLEPSLVLYWKNLNVGLNYDLPFYKATNGSQKSRCATNNTIMLTLGIRFKSKIWKYVGAGALAAGTIATSYLEATQQQTGYAEDYSGGMESNLSQNKKKTSIADNCRFCAGSGKCEGKNRCRGSGECKYCYGKGFNITAGQEHVCGVCNGKGKCSFCNGTGKCSHCHGSGKR
jgi:hypothetical protein